MEPMDNGELNDLYDKLAKAAKKVPTLHEHVKELCRDLRKPRKRIEKRGE